MQVVFSRPKQGGTLGARPTGEAHKASRASRFRSPIAASRSTQPTPRRVEVPPSAVIPQPGPMRCGTTASGDERMHQ
jgi:hypothetical protein